MAHPQLRLTASNPQVDIQVNMGDGPATPTAGYAGWEEVPRIKRRSMTDFIGLPPFQQDVPIRLDGFRENRSVERQLAVIESLGGNVIFRAFGPIFHSGDRFVFGDEPEFTELVRAHDGTLIRALLTLKLKEYVSPDQAGRRKSKGKIGLGNAVPLTHVVSKGETLSEIAFHLYHDASRWKEIGKKNGIHDAHKKLKPGRVLVL